MKLAAAHVVRLAETRGLTSPWAQCQRRRGRRWASQAGQWRWCCRVSSTAPMINVQFVTRKFGQRSSGTGTYMRLCSSAIHALQPTSVLTPRRIPTNIPLFTLCVLTPRCTPALHTGARQLTYNFPISRQLLSLRLHADGICVPRRVQARAYRLIWHERYLSRLATQCEMH